MQTHSDGFQSTYANLLTSLWDDMEDILELHCGRASVSDTVADQERLKLQQCLRRLAAMKQLETPLLHAELAAEQAARLRSLATELLRLLDVGLDDEDWAFDCVAQMVRAQGKIVDEFQRHANGDGMGEIPASSDTRPLA